MHKKKHKNLDFASSTAMRTQVMLALLRYIRSLWVFYYLENLALQTIFAFSMNYECFCLLWKILWRYSFVSNYLHFIDNDMTHPHRCIKLNIIHAIIGDRIPICKGALMWCCCLCAGDVILKKQKNEWTQPISLLTYLLYKTMWVCLCTNIKI